jgi:hypothetical protein
MSYNFRAVRTRTKVIRESPEGAAHQAASPADDTKVATEKLIGNLLAHVPTEAIALSTSLSPFTGNGAPPLRSWIALVSSFLLMCVVRYVNNASKSVWVTSVLAFLLWMALIPNSVLLPMYASWGADTQSVLMIATAFSAVVTVLTTAGRIK